VQVFVGAMVFCFTTGCCLKKREDRLSKEEEFVKTRLASVAFENDDKFQAV